MRQTTRAYALIYATMLLLLISFILISLRTSTGITLDRITNAHIRFQSSLYLLSLEQIAKICKQKPDFTQADFYLDSGFFGGFEIDSDTAFLYVQATNLRTGQTLRSTKFIKFP